MRKNPPNSRPPERRDERRPQPPRKKAIAVSTQRDDPAALKHSRSRAQLLYGIHPVTAAWLNPERRCLRLYATATALAEFRPVLEQAAGLGLKRPAPTAIERDGLDRLLPIGAVHQGLALDAEALPELNLDDVLIAAGDQPAAMVLLDQVTDPHNIGAILRSAAAFGAKAMIVHRRHTPEITGVMAKSASGAVDVIPMLRETNLARAIDALKEAGYVVIGLAEGAEVTLADAAFGSKVVLALGAEGEGLRRLIAEGCDVLASLPTKPPIGSLNVSNAAAVGLYEIARRLPR
jgi:23S rRNA (guanosine2251-2'-O)-methyltransferase